jgi:hypothetical protein
MDTIQGLLQERAKKLEISDNALKDVDAIDRVLVILGYDRNDANTIPVTNVKVETGFPKKALKKTQAEWLFRNVFTKAVKNKEIISKFQELSGLKKQDNFISHVRFLLNEDIIRAVKYANNNTKTYYGLAEWIDGTDFKKEYYPEDIEFDQYPTKLITNLNVMSKNSSNDHQISLM